MDIPKTILDILKESDKEDALIKRLKMEFESKDKPDHEDVYTIVKELDDTILPAIKKEMHRLGLNPAGEEETPVTVADNPEPPSKKEDTGVTQIILKLDKIIELLTTLTQQQMQITEPPAPDAPKQDERMEKKPLGSGRWQ